MDKKISEMFDGFELEPEASSDVRFDPERVRKATLERIHASGTAAAVRRKFGRTLLVAAVIACFMSATAYAAVYFSMHYRFSQEGERQRYTFTIYEPTDRQRTQTAEYEATMLLSFDTEPESYLYAIRANWLPSKPTHATSLRDHVWDMARGELGMKFFPENRSEEIQLEEKMTEIFEELGVTAEEAETWYMRYNSDTTYMPDTPEGPVPPRQDVELNIPYQISLSNSSSLYNFDFLVGYEGDTVEVVREETEGDWQILWLQMEQSVYRNTLLQQANIALRFNQAEGYLIQVIGTLDCETLDKIAENVEVLRTDVKTEADREERRFSVMSLGIG